MNDFYVYRHIRLDTNTPFYIGKGRKRRAYKKSGRNLYWKNIQKNSEYKVEILQKKLTEEEALLKEIKLIKLYKSLGYCEANLTFGGEGVSGYKWTVKQKQEHSLRMKVYNKQHVGKSHARGYKHTKEAKKRISKAHIGKVFKKETREKLSKAHTGKKLTKDHKKKISLANKGKFKEGKKVVCIDTGIIYNSTAEASRLLDINQSNISSVCRGIRKHVGNMKFKYLEDL